MAKQVLIVDDDRSAVKFLSAVLEEHGYEPVPAYDGNEGLRKVEQAKPGLIVLDLMMPKKSGFVMFKQLKRDERYKDIPVLVLTGVSGLIEELETRKDDMSEKPFDSLRESLKRTIQGLREDGLVKPEMFVDKPIDPDSFVAKVRELVGS